MKKRLWETLRALEVKYGKDGMPLLHKNALWSYARLKIASFCFPLFVYLLDSFTDKWKQAPVLHFFRHPPLILSIFKPTHPFFPPLWWKVWSVSHVLAADDCIYQCVHRNQSGTKKNENVHRRSMLILQFRSHMVASHQPSVRLTFTHTHSHYTNQ